MKILVVGAGGREHALAWKLSQSCDVEKVFVAPGNAGTALEPSLENVPIDSMDIPGLINFAQEVGVGLTVVGPELPLVAGIVDAFEAANLLCLGPSAKAARLEGSKTFCKDFLARHNIPTASYASFTTYEQALAHVNERQAPMVIKADGLAAGKGVYLPKTHAEAQAALADIFEADRFGDAGKRVVVEDFLEGEEASFIALCDGKNIVPFATSQDHKARDNGDTGPNTGGMGAYSPAPVVTPEVHDRIMKTVIEPTVAGMAKDGVPFTGFLYAGLMISPEGALSVLEYNCRFGDPETQPIMMRLQSDFAALCLSAAQGKLASDTISWDSRPALGVVLAAGGYPDAYEKNLPITGLETTLPENVKVFHAGTKLNADGQVITQGGRVLCVAALGESVLEAQTSAYEACESIRWPNRYSRTDIGHRAIAREQKG